jgi:glutamate-1-semialdehyde 2,1-aminomutase
VPRKLAISQRMFERAAKSLVGGVGGNGRGTHFGFKPHPLFIERGTGAYLEDVDGNTYIDYLAAWGPLILGHRNPAVINSVTTAVNELGSMIGLGHRFEIEAAESAIAAVPCWDLVRFGNTGSEAVIAALRLARGVTGRQLILRFEGHFHGWTDLINFSAKPDLAKAGDELRPTPVPSSLGMASVLAETLLVRQWGDTEALEQTFKEFGSKIAGVICEPIMANVGVIAPDPAYLQQLRDLTKKYGALLIFDEVKTGFRVALGGAQELYGVIPDVSVAAKALGAGFPISAVGGSRALFEAVIDGRIVYSATYHTNPIGLAACIAALKEMRVPGFFERITALGNALQTGLTAAAEKAGIRALATGVGPLFQLFFADRAPRNYRDAVRLIDAEAYREFWALMLERGILFNPHPQECWFVSSAHSEREVEKTLDAASDAFQVMKKRR